MNVPLSWLSEYVELPKNLNTLTDRLTSVGHMLDKVKKVGKETVIDLELRGNRADMFGLIGIARDIAAAFAKTLKLPPAATLPQIDPKSSLVKAEKSARDLVERYIAIKLSVKVGPSPTWLANRLTAYGIDPINNVVDVTNYVMIETSHPMHAFDFDRLNGGRIILRSAKDGEKFATIQQGTVLTLTPHDLAVCDASSVQGLTTIGGLDSKITVSTKTIILETAVYNAASSRHTARRHKTFTESGLRHEKHQDPSGLPFALARAVYLLQQTAAATVQSPISDYFPFPKKPTTVDFSPSEVHRLAGLSISTPKITSTLQSLGFTLIPTQSSLKLTVPTFRTDIEHSADIVEEIVRLVGYDTIPETPLSGSIPDPQTYPGFALQEQIRNILTSLGVSETITSSVVKNDSAIPTSIHIINPPDPAASYLRHSLITNLIPYVQKLLNHRKTYIRFFEIGKVFANYGQKYQEHLHMAIAVAGLATPASWRHTSPRPADVYDLKGIIDSFQKLAGLKKLNASFGAIDNIFWFETNLDDISISAASGVYRTISQYPPVIEDVNVTLSTDYSSLIKRIKKTSPLIKDVQLIDKYDSKLTLRLTYHSDSRQLSTTDITPVRKRLMELG